MLLSAQVRDVFLLQQFLLRWFLLQCTLWLLANR
jgi:hypothetical protein